MPVVVMLPNWFSKYMVKISIAQNIGYRITFNIKLVENMTEIRVYFLCAFTRKTERNKLGTRG